MSHAIDRFLKLLVCVNRNILYKILVSFYIGESVIASIFCILGLSNQTTKHCPLQHFSSILMLLQFSLPRLKYLSNYTCYTHFCAYLAAKLVQAERNGACSKLLRRSRVSHVLRAKLSKTIVTAQKFTFFLYNKV